MIGTRYVVKKLEYKTDKVDYVGDGPTGKYFGVKTKEYLSDVKIIGIYKNKYIAEDVLNSLNLAYPVNNGVLGNPKCVIEEIAWED